jgi:hypothetical protein
MARYGYGISVSGSRTAIVASSGVPAPSGIPVATTSSVIVSSSPDGFNGTYDKVTEQYYAEIINGNKQIVWNSEDVGVPDRWSLANFDTNFFVTHQTWSDQTQIPASGWPNGEIITAD